MCVRIEAAHGTLSWEMKRGRKGWRLDRERERDCLSTMALLQLPPAVPAIVIHSTLYLFRYGELSHTCLNQFPSGFYFLDPSQFGINGEKVDSGGSHLSSNACSAIYKLCDLGRVTYSLCASVAFSVT